MLGTLWYDFVGECIDILDLVVSAVAAFGSGAVFSAVSGMGGPNVLGNALTTGFFFALVQGGLYQVLK